MWDERYSEPGWAYGTDPNDFLVEVAGELPPNGRVLVLAAGQGRNAVWLAGLGHRVTAVDSSGIGLQRALELAASRGVGIEVIRADLTTWDLGEAAWDGVVSMWSPLTEDERRIVHAKVARALKPGGVYLMEAYRPEQLAYGTGGPRSVERLVRPEVLPTELAGLRIERLESMDREVHEGTYHDGKSAVVQVVARRAP